MLDVTEMYLPVFLLQCSAMTDVGGLTSTCLLTSFGALDAQTGTAMKFFHPQNITMGKR